MRSNFKDLKELTVLELLPVEVDVAEVKNGGDDPEYDILLLQSEPQHLHT